MTRFAYCVLCAALVFVAGVAAWNAFPPSTPFVEQTCDDPPPPDGTHVLLRDCRLAERYGRIPSSYLLTGEAASFRLGHLDREAENQRAHLAQRPEALRRWLAREHLESAPPIPGRVEHWYDWIYGEDRYALESSSVPPADRNLWLAVGGLALLGLLVLVLAQRRWNRRRDVIRGRPAEF